MSATHLSPPVKHELVRDIMSRQILRVGVSESLWDAWQLLFVSGLRHLVVTDEDGSCLGILSDRGILAQVPATPEHLAERSVREILGHVPMVSVGPQDDPQVAGRLMIANSVEAVPVLDDQGRVLGVVTEADLVRWVVE